MAIIWIITYDIWCLGVSSLQWSVFFAVSVNISSFLWVIRLVMCEVMASCVMSQLICNIFLLSLCSTSLHVVNCWPLIFLWLIEEWQDDTECQKRELGDRNWRQKENHHCAIVRDLFVQFNRSSSQGRVGGWRTFLMNKHFHTVGKKTGISGAISHKHET